jgi:hypothetical protein
MYSTVIRFIRRVSMIAVVDLNRAPDNILSGALINSVRAEGYLKTLFMIPYYRKVRRRV